MTFQSMTFDSNGRAVDTTLESHIRPNNVVPDSQRANVGIGTAARTSVVDTYQQHTGAQTAPSITSVQLAAHSGLVKVPGTNHEVTPEVLETMRSTSPELFIEPEVKAAEIKVEADTSKAEEAARVEANRHPDEIEGYHQHIVSDVAPQDLIGLMVAGQKGEAPAEALLQRIAGQMHEPLDRAIDKVNLVSRGVQAQFTIMAQKMNLDADKAADWIRDHRKGQALAAAQDHFLRRNMAAWTPLLKDYRASTGDGVRH